MGRHAIRRKPGSLGFMTYVVALLDALRCNNDLNHALHGSREAWRIYERLAL